MATASRTIRPYQGLASLSTIFENSLLHFGTDLCSADKRLHIELHPHEFLLRPVSLEWAPDDGAFQDFLERARHGLRAAELEPSTVELVVIAKSPYLKLADLVFRRRASDLAALPRRVELTRSQARALSAPFSGFEIVVAFALACHLPRAALKPYRKGTWLTRAIFGVDTRLSHVVFSPVPLTPEIRTSLKIGAKATRFIDLDHHDITQPIEGQEEPKFYVDAELLAQLNVRRASPMSKALQAQLALDFVSTIIRHAYKSELTGIRYEEIRSSLLGSVVRMLAGEAADESKNNEILAMILDRPTQAIANLEHVFNVTKMYTDALTSEEES